MRLQSSPEAIARGLAAGVFAGCFPLFGLQIMIGIALSIPLRGNKIMAAAGTWISNPFTYVPIFLFNFQIGRWLLGQQGQTLDLAKVGSWPDAVVMGSDWAGALFLGSFVVGAIAALGSYVGSLWLVRRIQRRLR